MTLEPRLVLRRIGPRFFGKILKVDLIVTLANPPSLPCLRPRACGVAADPGLPAAKRWGVPVGIWLVVALLGMARAAGQGPAPAAGPAESIYQKNAPAPAGVSGDQEGPQAERIVSAALAALRRAGTISARVRQRVRVGDRVLVGAGRYVQSGLGEDQRYRFEVTMKSDTETFDVLEVCDGLFAWSYRRIGSQPPQLERVDVRRVRERIHQLQPTDDAAISPHLGGVQRTLALLRTWFRFVSVEPAAIDDLPIWLVEGRWNPESLAALLPEQAEAATRPGGITPAELPDGTPWGVRLSIGKRDLFPFRIEWLAVPGRRPVPDREPEPVAVLELYEVRLGDPVDASAFVYKPATEGLIDLTESHVQRLAPLRP